MSALYTQIVARGGRPTEVLSRGLGFSCVSTHERRDSHLGTDLRSDRRANCHPPCQDSVLPDRQGRARHRADEGTGFWCKLYENGQMRCEHNRLVGPRDFAPEPADMAEVYALCSALGVGSSGLEVHDILNSPRYERAAERHAALAAALGLPAFSPGLGYTRFMAGAATWDGPKPDGDSALQHHHSAFRGTRGTGAAARFSGGAERRSGIWSIDSVFRSCRRKMPRRSPGLSRQPSDRRRRRLELRLSDRPLYLIDPEGTLPRPGIARRAPGSERRDSCSVAYGAADAAPVLCRDPASLCGGSPGWRSEHRNADPRREGQGLRTSGQRSHPCGFRPHRRDP